MLSRPDILVLGGGGVLGEAWINGVLAGIEDESGFDLRRCEYFVGTSAGSIVAARLVAGQRPERPAQTRQELELARPENAGAGTPAMLEAARRGASWALALSSPLAPTALGLAAPGGAILRATLLRAIPRPHGILAGLREHVDASGARFDGRLRVVAVERRSGRRVVFGSPRAPDCTVGEAVAASCTVPWLFEPVRIDGADYVDGGVWSPTNLDAAPAGRDTQVLCLSPLGSIAAAGSLIAFARNLVRSAVSLEELALRRRGARVRIISPDVGAAGAMGQNLMDREPRGRVLAAAYTQGCGLAASDPPSVTAR
jgi:NTE family protein